jgi:hypothetical protein
MLPDHTVLTQGTVVQLRFDPYDHSAFQTLLRRINREFGASGADRAWSWAPVWDDPQENVWTVEFYWRDPCQATLFALKYQG